MCFAWLFGRRISSNRRFCFFSLSRFEGGGFVGEKCVRGNSFVCCFVADAVAGLKEVEYWDGVVRVFRWMRIFLEWGFGVSVEGALKGRDRSRFRFFASYSFLEERWFR